MLGDPSVRLVDVHVPVRFSVVVAFTDCFTRLGGNQYVSAALMGASGDFLLQEMLPTIEQRFGGRGAGRLVRWLKRFGHCASLRGFPRQPQRL
jgi:hypothetical protein